MGGRNRLEWGWIVCMGGCLLGQDQLDIGWWRLGRSGRGGWWCFDLRLVWHGWGAEAEEEA